MLVLLYTYIYVYIYIYIYVCIYIYSTNIPPIMIINRIYETQILLSRYFVSFLYGLCTYDHSCTESVADKSLARPTSLCILFDGQDISFDANFVIYINSTNITQIVNIYIYIYI
jgi:hypothetical protein